MSSNVEGAELFVNGGAAGTLPSKDPVRVVAGRVHVELRATGFLPAQTEIRIAAGETTTVRVELTESDAAPPRPPDAVGPSPSSVEPSRPPKSSSTRRVLTYGLAGLGAVGLGIGTVVGVNAIGYKNDRDALCDASTCRTEEGLRLDTSARDAATVSTAALIGGGVALVAAAVMFFTESK